VSPTSLLVRSRASRCSDGTWRWLSFGDNVEVLSAVVEATAAGIAPRRPRNPHRGLVSDVETSHDGRSFGLDGAAPFDHPYRKEPSCKPSPFETAMPVSVACP
jgi:hypothetical protein